MSAVTKDAAPPDELERQAAATIAAGSKSFAAAARLFDAPTRRGAILLYAWCRHCDDVVDGQRLGFGGGDAEPRAAERRLAELRRRTDAALAGEPAAHPAFAALQEVARRHAIPRALAVQHLDGFAMDVAGQRYHSEADLLRYCYHVAGVVGIMMSMVMGARAPSTLDRACDLGIAFQLTNIARDIVEDARNGRIYLPRTWLDEVGIAADAIGDPANRPALARLAARLVDRAEPYYASARVGLRDLPWRSAWAVATALDVYRRIGVEVKRRGAAAWDERISTSAGQKLRSAGTGGGLVVRSRLAAGPPRPPGLWTRPR